MARAASNDMFGIFRFRSADAWSILEQDSGSKAELILWEPAPHIAF